MYPVEVLLSHGDQQAAVALGRFTKGMASSSG